MIRGAIFDLDGTIVDNMALHMEAFAIFSERHGLPPLTKEDRRRLDGRRNKDIFPDLFNRSLSEAELLAHAGEKESLYRSLSAGRLVPLAGFDRLVAALDRRSIPIAIATSAPLDNVLHTLREIGLDRDALPIVRSDEVARGKPWPDVFLAAAARVGRAPEECVAFEDAPIGVAAAVAAGMETVAVTTSFSAADFAGHASVPRHVIATFDDYLEGPGRWLRVSPTAP
ncbi:MAG TPA: HAD family phosphatase [Vicinamibacterales bacterium]|nr:HAD family phosphatase [Vicinamibacterales bacterium]